MVGAATLTKEKITAAAEREREEKRKKGRKRNTLEGKIGWIR